VKNCNEVYKVAYVVLFLTSLRLYLFILPISNRTKSNLLYSCYKRYLISQPPPCTIPSELCSVGSYLLHGQPSANPSSSVYVSARTSQLVPSSYPTDLQLELICHLDVNLPGFDLTPIRIFVTRLFPYLHLIPGNHITGLSSLSWINSSPGNLPYLG
jgi:hypothetical protein